VKPPLDLLQGTLDLLILHALTAGPSHGYGIATSIKDSSGNRLVVEDKALYVSLHRMEERGWVSSAWGVSDNNRRAKYYELTTIGRRTLRQKTSDWTAYVNAVFGVLNPAGASS
jgi:PadR family transcriptional regulator, regulatory protein PadR